MPRLTKRTIDAFKPRPKDYIVFDVDIAGFGVRVLPSSKKSYLVQYRSGGRTRRVTFGRVGTLTPDEARREARRLLGTVAGGDNPAQAKSDHRTAPTVKSVCERFMREYVAERCKPSTQREYKRSIELFVEPAFGTHKIVDITRTDVARLHHAMRDKPYQANRTLGVLSKMFNMAELWGLRPDGSNPCRHVQKYKEHKRERFLSADELARLGQVLAAAEAEGSESPFAVAAIRLLILTGCRLSEIQTLRWSYVGQSYLELPDSKTGARKIPLSPAAVTALDALPRDLTNPYVIAGDRPGQHLTDLQRPWRRIRARAGLNEVRIHDLRHTYASNAIAQGLSIPMVGKLLGHTQIQTTMRYAHLADDPIREAAQLVSADLDAAMRGPSEAGPPPLRLVK